MDDRKLWFCFRSLFLSLHIQKMSLCYGCCVFFPRRTIFIIFNFCALQHPNAIRVCCVSVCVCEAHFHVYIYDAIWFSCDMCQMYSYFTIQAYICRTIYEPWGDSIGPPPLNLQIITISQFYAFVVFALYCCSHWLSIGSKSSLYRELFAMCTHKHTYSSHHAHSRALV